MRRAAGGVPRIRRFKIVNWYRGPKAFSSCAKGPQHLLADGCLFVSTQILRYVRRRVTTPLEPRASKPPRPSDRGRMSAPRVDPLAGKPAPASLLVEYSPARHRVLHRAARPRRARAARGVRHLGASRLVAHGELQRGAHPRRDPGHLPLPEGAGDRRAALPRGRHARADRTRAGERARGARRERRRRHAATATAAPRRRRSSRRPSSTTTAAAAAGLADGIVITPSHNPPDSGGFKYDPPSGGPADTEATRWIEDRANQFLAAGLAGVRAHPVRARAPGADDAPLRLRRRLCRRARRRHRHGAAPRQLAQDRRRPARGRQRRVLGAHRRAVRPAARGRERRRSTRRFAS